ncbi:MAG: sucrase ferredoxin [Nodularia sp. (in: Bacteria)]|nr:MAG: sucrase ferredoxin [Nodularia sp. (in: cyanobacteria)]
MTTPKLLTDCQFCSVISKENGEDPIGTANPCSGWLVMELPLPWTEERFDSDPILQPIHDLFHELYDQGIRVAPMAIASDREYSIPGLSRVFYYQRPASTFAQFEKQEFLLPPNQIAQLAKALIFESANLPQFEQYRKTATPIRQLMVCTHGNVDIACARFGQPIYQILRQQYASSSSGELEVWRCSHFGGHQFAPTLVDFPTGQVWGHLEPEILEVLVQRNHPVTKLRSFYRGWSGLSKFEQIVEREIWMQEGWDWLKYHKLGRILAKDNANEEANWAEVQIDFATPDSRVTGSYAAKVEVYGSVISAYNSGQALTTVKQYQVSQLRRIT